MEQKPRIALIFTGGTIDSVGTDRLDLAWYIEAGKRLEAGELVARVPELDTIARVEEIAFRRLPSQAITDQDLILDHSRISSWPSICSTIAVQLSTQSPSLT